MGDHVPAWKKVGLKQKTKKQESFDPLKDGIKRSAAEAEVSAPRKEPKRKKLPKSERPPPPEADQLVYLRTFHENKANWKFSKQKQNWIIKNLFEISPEYEDALESYIKDIKGSSKDRIIEDCQLIVTKWNDYMKEEDEKEDKPEDSEPAKEAESKSSPSEKPEPTQEDAQKSGKLGETSKNKSGKSTPDVKPPTDAQAKRAGSLLKTLTGETPTLDYLE